MKPGLRITGCKLGHSLSMNCSASSFEVMYSERKGGALAEEISTNYGLISDSDATELSSRAVLMAESLLRDLYDF